MTMSDYMKITENTVRSPNQFYPKFWVKNFKK